MRHLLICLSVMLLLLVIFTGCGGSQLPTPTPTVDPKVAKQVYENIKASLEAEQAKCDSTSGYITETVLERPGLGKVVVKLTEKDGSSADMREMVFHVCLKNLTNKSIRSVSGRFLIYNSGYDRALFSKDININFELPINQGTSSTLSDVVVDPNDYIELVKANIAELRPVYKASYIVYIDDTRESFPDN